MQIEVMTAITIVSILIGIYGTVKGLQSSKSKEDKAEATENAMIITKLEGISKDTTEIKNEIKSIKADTKQNSEQIIRIDESLKGAWRAINKLQDIKANEDDGK